MSRRRALRSAGTVGLLAAVAAAACTAPVTEDEGGAPEASPVPHHSYVSRPDLTPPRIWITQGPAAEPTGPDQSREYIFLGLRNEAQGPFTGGLIVDTEGEPVWVAPVEEDGPGRRNYDLRPQIYAGEPVLTWWDGVSATGYGNGDVRMIDASYQEVATITTGGDLEPGRVDLHETTVTSQGTMLITAYIPTRADLSAVGGPQEGWVRDGVLQEIDIATGAVTFEWRSLDHIPVTDNVQEFPELAEENEGLGTEDAPFDYFHLNSITEDDDGSLLVSARNTHAVYQINRDSGQVNWILGGESSDFDLGDGAHFAWQHTAARQPDGTLTLFDNQAAPPIGDQARGLRLDLDTEAMIAEVVTEYEPRQPERLSSSMGSFQELENGNVFIGWGSQPYYSEHTASGEVVYEAWLGGPASYRAYRASWVGEPTTPPDVALRRSETEAVAYVSWNGATEVARWRLLAGADEASAEEFITMDRAGFETALPAPDDADYIIVEALDEEGRVLGTGVPD